MSHAGPDTLAYLGWLPVRRGSSSVSGSGIAPVPQCPAKEHNQLRVTGHRKKIYKTFGVSRRKSRRTSRLNKTDYCVSTQRELQGVQRCCISAIFWLLERRDRLKSRGKNDIYVPILPVLLCCRPQWWSSPWNRPLNNNRPVCYSFWYKCLTLHQSPIILQVRPAVAKNIKVINCKPSFWACSTTKSTSCIAKCTAKGQSGSTSWPETNRDLY